MNERLGVGVAILSSALGAAAAVATRYLIASADPSRSPPCGSAAA